MEHDLAFLKMESKLSSVYIELLVYINEVNIKSIEIQSNIDNGWFNKDASDTYLANYKANALRLKSYSEMIDNTKMLLAVKLSTSDPRTSFSEAETNVLKALSESIDKAYTLLKVSMDKLKYIIDSYQKLVQENN